MAARLKNRPSRCERGDRHPSDTTPYQETGFELQHLIRSGMLFELQDWIAEGKPLSPCARVGSAIVEAATAGFHSMVKVLLDAQPWETRELARATSNAALRGFAEIAKLLLLKPGVAEQLKPCELSYCINYEVWEMAIRSGMPLRGCDGFGYTLGSVCARPMLRLFRDLAPDFPDLELEGRVALVRAVELGSPRKVALLIWAGVDPLQPHRDADEPGDWTEALFFAPAATAAIWNGRADLLRLMKLRPTEEQWWSLLDHGLMFGSNEVLQVVVELNRDAPAVVAGRTEMHGKLLESAVHRTWPQNFIAQQKGTTWPVHPVLANVGTLLNLGVRLSSSDRENLKRIRAFLYRASDTQVIAIVDKLATIKEPNHMEGLLALVDKPKLRSIVQRWNIQLYRRFFPERKQGFKGKQRLRMTSKSRPA